MYKIDIIKTLKQMLEATDITEEQRNDWKSALKYFEEIKRNKEP